MSHTQNTDHAPQEEGPISLQHDAEHVKPRNKQQSVLIYLVILFAAAFLLMALSYFMQRRTSNATIEGLRESVSAMQSVEDIQAENQALKDQISDLEEQLAQSEQARDDLEALTDSLSLQQAQLTRAMDLFWQIDEAYVRGRYTLCLELIQKMEDASSGNSLKEYLPTESTTNNDRYSPADRYQEIYDNIT